GKPIDVRSDIYSLGVMAYEMLTGRLPFQAETAWEWATQHMTVQPVPLETQPNGGNIPDKMRGAIMRSLAQTAANRFGNGAERCDAFTGKAALAAPGTAAMGAHGPQFQRGGTAVLGAGGAAGAVGAGAVVQSGHGTQITPPGGAEAAAVSVRGKTE